MERDSHISDVIASWRPGEILLGGSEESGIWVGDSILAAVPVCEHKDTTKVWWEFSVITATEDGWDSEGDSWGWSTEDIEWFVSIKRLAQTLPPVND